MANARLVCLDTDDLMHPNTGEENYNESAYYNFYDPRARLGGFVRLGNRPNEHYAEMTICLYLPDGRVGFMYARPKIADNSRFDAAGMRFDVTTPMREHRIRYDGNVCLLARPLDLLDPKAAFTQNPHVPARLELTYTAVARAHGGEPRTQDDDGQWVSVKTERAGQEFARGHLEQHGHAVGRLVLDGVETAIDGYGLRDRSWGPRYWQAPDHYRWLTMNFGPDAGIAAARTVQRDGSVVQGGFLFEPGVEGKVIASVEVETQHGEENLHRTLRATLQPADGGAPQVVEGRVLAMVPLRNRRNGVTTRIAEGLTEWKWGDRVGYGWSEYLDHVG
jgi:hypothetical protein